MAVAANKSVLFVCLGNICRSVTSEALFRQLAEEKGFASDWKIDSAATSTYQIGDEPDSRTNQTLEKMGRKRSKHIARQITKQDFKDFQYIFGFDQSNISNINRVKPKDSKSQVLLMGKYGKNGDEIVEDPYYHDMAAFDTMYEQCDRCVRAFIAEVEPGK
ncbi:low molecular weight phosphotyrosine protein phosphatase [Strongylocentrotus purpuratus]|uniref:Low molecular weight phosphotyrosine protein phosphatase n=1 Tax=Strongylocentrotus purpuratus TaxID=7668 RepID=A0A7M7PBN4_STRPU|nr:low molecular weight phosphotyrosine protein phosphatase-like [Strongylocentrotus purpuratus]XP_030849287.1 low molecular weight phosphotyrosine protein phosphatase [Strongylocentrotus purpuratus]|eukprot:XP_003723716.1 PREDICTED: low molecular weight phosphotyrosine protein phosphatase isoform X2 [Strongylocentrotus purpuratus]